MAKNGNYTEGYGGGRYYEHRLVAEVKLGRSLLPGETVHHANKDGFDNRPDNIWVFRTNSDHARYHKTHIAILHEDGTYTAGTKQPKNICPVCKKPCFRKFCSNGCAKYGSRKVVRPPVEEICNMLKTMSFCAVGRSFGVSDNTIRKWIGK
jgi:hypothetical protein